MHRLVVPSKAETSDKETTFIIKEPEPFERLEAASSMTADPNFKAFLYLLTTGKEYIYIQFREEMWPYLASALQQQLLPVVVWGEQRIPLQAFREELWRVLDESEGGRDTMSESGSLERIFKKARAFRLS